jgi:hypothetical protein
MTLWPAMQIVVVPWIHQDPDVIVRWLEADYDHGMYRVVIVLDESDSEARGRIAALALPNVETVVVDSQGFSPEVTVAVRVAGTELVIPVDSSTTSTKWMLENIEMPFVRPAFEPAADALTTVERLEISFAEPSAASNPSKRTTKLPPPLARPVVEPQKAYSILDDFDEDAEYGDGGKVISAAPSPSPSAAPPAPSWTATTPVHIQTPVPPAWDTVTPREPAPRTSPAPRIPPSLTTSTATPRTPPAVPERSEFRSHKSAGHEETTSRFSSVEDLAVAAVLQGGRSVEDVARTLRLSPAAVALWVSKADPTRARS